MQNKGQAAVEFLMTYGWAILVVLIAIGALWYFVGNPADLAGDFCRLSAPLSCSSQKATTITTTLLIRNGYANTITVDSATLTDLVPVCTLVGPVVITSGSTAELAIPCVQVSGAKIKSTLQIQYDETGGLTDVIKNGDVLISVP